MRNEKLKNSLGMSPSRFKTKLKLLGFKVRRAFFKYGNVAKYNNRLYRFRCYSEEGFVVDVSCELHEFDRWANSVDKVVGIDYIIDFKSELEKP